MSILGSSFNLQNLKVTLYPYKVKSIKGRMNY